MEATAAAAAAFLMRCWWKANVSVTAAEGSRSSGHAINKAEEKAVMHHKRHHRTEWPNNAA